MQATDERYRRDTTGHPAQHRFPQTASRRLIEPMCLRGVNPRRGEAVRVRLADLASDEAAGGGDSVAADAESYRAIREVMAADPDLVHFERSLRDIVAGVIARYVES